MNRYDLQELKPGLAFSPGFVLKEELEARGMTQRELAARLKRPEQMVSEIVRAKKSITPETALELEKVLGITAQFWINLEALYQMTLAQGEEQDRLAKWIPLLKEFPIAQMQKRGWLPKVRNEIEQVRDLLKFLGVASLDGAWMETATGFRITGGVGKVSPGALAAWLRKGMQEAEQITSAPYDEQKFRATLGEIRKLTVLDVVESTPKMQTLCAEAGVALVLIPELPKSGANGATRWITSTKALIQLSIRYKWADIFWFSFFHEVAHILMHPHNKVTVEGVDHADPRMEKEADQFAADLLNPPDTYASFCSSADFSASAVGSYAKHIGVAPGIVVGRLQHDGFLKYDQLASLKVRLKWAEDAE